MRVYQQVVYTDIQDVHNSVPGARRIKDTLACGHEQYYKYSDGMANKRMCRQCTSLARHPDNICYHNDVKETWDFENNCLKRESITTEA